MRIHNPGRFDQSHQRRALYGGTDHGRGDMEPMERANAGHLQCGIMMSRSEIGGCGAVEKVDP
jgi:hypothetical protein